MKSPAYQVISQCETFFKKFMVNQLFVLYELGFSPLNLIIVTYKDFK